MKFSVRMILTLSTAVLLFLSFPPLNLFPLSWIAFVPFFFAIRKTSRLTHFKLGWILSFSMTVLGFYWIVYTMQEFGQLPLWLSLILFGIYALFAASHLTLFSFFLYELSPGQAGGRHNRKPLPPLWDACLTAAIFVSFEYLVPQLFPWLIGYSQRGNFYFIQIADLAGTYLISFLILFANRLIYLTFTTQSYQKTRVVWGGFVVVILAIYGYGYLRVQTIQHVMAKAKPIKVGMAQTNVGNLDKVMAQYGVAEALQKNRDNYEALVRKAGEAAPDLIVLPETSVSGIFSRDNYVRFQVFNLASEVRAALFFGGYHQSRQGKYTLNYNSSYLVSQHHEVLGHYDKIYLLMFGEYLPFSDLFPQLKDVVENIGDFSRGEDVRVFPFLGESLAPLICYEAIIPAFVRKFVRRGATFFVNITNDSWFGDTLCPYQHQALATFRTVEYRRPMVRVANTGISCFVDATGKIYGETPLFKPAVEVQEIRPIDITTLYAVIGDLFPLICSLVILSALARRISWCRMKKRGRGRSG